jgi:hypothetical protein
MYPLFCHLLTSPLQHFTHVFFFNFVLCISPFLSLSFYSLLVDHVFSFYLLIVSLLTPFTHVSTSIVYPHSSSVSYCLLFFHLLPGHLPCWFLYSCISLIFSYITVPSATLYSIILMPLFYQLLLPSLILLLYLTLYL